MQWLVPAVATWSMALTSSELMLPLADLGELYQRSWAAIDFFLLFALFAGTARATVGRRLEGREGQLVSLALGAMLGLAGLGLEISLGVNLTALGRWLESSSWSSSGRPCTRSWSAWVQAS